MKRAGIKTEYPPKGVVKRITTNDDVQRELVEDLTDKIVFEQRKTREFVSNDEAMEVLRKSGKI